MTQGATHHSQIPKRGRIRWFHVLGHPEENPPLTHQATIVQEGNHLRLTGYGGITKEMKATGNPIEYLWTLTFNQEWSLELQVVGNLDVLLEQVVGGNRLGVSDGSYRKGSGTAAWIVEGTTADHCMLGQICTPGVDTDHSSFQSKLAGIYSLLFTLWHLTRGQPKWRFCIACDGKLVLSKLQHLSYTEPTKAHADLLSATCWLLWHWGEVELVHVRGHQDEQQSGPLMREALLNVEADLLAKEKLQRFQQGPKEYQIPFGQGCCYCGSSWVVKGLVGTL